MRPFLHMSGISKSFPGVRALDHVDLVLRQGEVHAIAGENGAGKSTLMKILAGAIEADAGVIEIDGVATSIRDPQHARALGISIIYQELSIVENLTVAENIFLAAEPTGRFGFVNSRRMIREAKEVLGALRLDVNPATRVGDLSVGQKQMIEIAKAISHRSRIIIMDEPTASLSHHEAETLISVVKALRSSNIGIVYITHRLDEIFEIADRVTVLRDGRTVDSAPIAEMTREHLVRKMVDRELSQLYGEHVSHAATDVVMAVRGLGLRHPTPHVARVRDIGFDLRQGEVLGFFGLVGAGRTEILEMIFGLRPYRGEIRIAGHVADIRSPSDAMAHGLGFISEDRKAQGLVLGMNVRENFSLTHLKDYCRFDFVNEAQERQRCHEHIGALRIRTPSMEQKTANLSGGNQQKVVIAKWIARDARILMVDEPTRGIDIGAKAEVHAILSQLAARGKGIIVVSSDIAEVLAVSDRILVVRGGQISAELVRADATRERVMELATG